MSLQVPHTADWAPGRRVPVEAILSPLRRGSGDPTWWSSTGEVWRALRTPEGPATVRWRTVAESGGDRVVATGWGPGGPWALERLAPMLGGRDDLSGFTPVHEAVREAARRHTDWRVGRSGLVIEALLPAIIEQRVTGKQAFGAYRRLVRAHGEPAPGPGAGRGLVVPPEVERWRRIPSWQWLRAGVDAQRADTIMRVLQVAPALDTCVDLPRSQAWKRLRSVPGIGGWTASETAQRALGDADAISFGDYHVPTDLGWALIGGPVDDVGLEELMEPYRGHRYRVQWLITAARLGRPRRGPRMAVPTHLPRP